MKRLREQKSEKQFKKVRHQKMKPYNRQKQMDLLNSKQPIVKTTENLIKNDCPLNCDTTYCDQCPFRAKVK